MKLATAIVALAITGTAAEAACNQSHINNRTWKLTAHLDAKDPAPAALIFCSFKTKGNNGNVVAATEGCEITALPSADFASPIKYDIEAGSSIVATDQKCTFDATINLKAGETTSVMRARLVMESGKTIAAGNFLMGDSGGTVAVLRQ